MLAKLAEVTISERHVGRLTLAVGAELQAERDTRVAALPPQTQREQQPGPAPAVVAVDERLTRHMLARPGSPFRKYRGQPAGAAN